MVGQQAVGVGSGDQHYVVGVAFKKEAVVFGRSKDGLAVVAAVADVVEVSGGEELRFGHLKNE